MKDVRDNFGVSRKRSIRDAYVLLLSTFVEMLKNLMHRGISYKCSIIAESLVDGDRRLGDQRLTLVTVIASEM